MIDYPCPTCARHKRCADERGMAKAALFAHGRGEACPVCPTYREATWRGLDVPLRRPVSAPVHPVFRRVRL